MVFEYNSNKVYFEKFGNSKKSIVILPGWGDNRKSFYNIINNLKDKFSIYIFDYPGFGNSPNLKSDFTIYNYAELIISFIKNKNIKNPIVIGHSFGGRIAILLDGYYNLKFKKLILISSAGIKPIINKKRSFKQKIYKCLKKFSSLFPSKLKEKYLEFLIQLFGSDDYKNLSHSLRKTFINVVNEDLTIYLKNIKSQTLLVWGENDIDTPLSDGLKMEKEIKNSKLIIIKRATHFSYLEYPLYINSIINSFLNQKKQ